VRISARYTGPRFCAHCGDTSLRSKGWVRRKVRHEDWVERYFRRGLQRQFKEWHPPRCPSVLGIDEQFFTRRKGYATTFYDLRHRKVYDVVLGRSEAALEALRSPPCGASPAITASPKDSTTRWNSSPARAYGFRNFQSYRMRVKVLCG
jgi:hypothetical protein